MGLKSFGDGIDTYGEGSSVMDLVGTKTITDDISKQLSLMEEYDKTFKLFDHSMEKDLISVMYMHPEEDPVSHSRSVVLINELMGLRIPELTGDPLSMLLTYPKWLLDHLIEIGSKNKEREKELVDKNPIK